MSNVYWEITDVCNLDCAHCYNASSVCNHCFANASEVKKVLDGLSHYGFKRVSFSGGEPLLHADIEEICCYARRLGLEVYLITNGVLLSEKTLAWIMSHNIYLQISLESDDREINDAIRGYGEYNRVMKSLELLRTANYLDHIYLHMTPQKMNYKTVATFAQFAKMKGCRGAGYSQWAPLGRGRVNNEKMRLSAGEQIWIIETVRNSARALNDETFSLDDYVCVDKCGLVLGEGIISPYINSKGELFPCSGFHEEKFSMGNVYKKCIGDIITNEALCRVIDTAKEGLEKCNDCIISDMCGKGCLALHQNPQVSGDGFCLVRKKTLMSIARGGK